MSSTHHTRAPVPEAKPGLEVADIYYILFRRKWLLLIGTLLGLLAAGVLFRAKKPLYQSQAKVLVRYIVDAPLSVTPGQDQPVRQNDIYGGTIMPTEREILSTTDLAREVAAAVGPRVIIAKPGGGDDVDYAASIIMDNLRVETPTRSDIINILYQHTSPPVVTNVLSHLLDAYLRKHVHVHSSDDGIEDITLTNQVADRRRQLADVEESIRRLKADSGVVSIDEAKKIIIDHKAKIEQDLVVAQADLEGAKAALREQAPDSLPAPKTNTASSVSPSGATPPEKADEYRDLIQRELFLSKRDWELSSTFTPDAPVRKTNSLLLQQVRAAKTQLETVYPSIVSVARTAVVTPIAVPLSPATNSVQALRSQIVTLEARINVWTRKLEDLREEASKLDGCEAQMTVLQRTKTNLEKELAMLEERLRQKRARQAIGGDRAPNISIVQMPSPAYRKMSPLYKKMGMAVAGGLGAAIGLAFLLELLLDRSIKRPKDVEAVLPGHLFVTIPALDMSAAGPRRPANGQIAELSAPRIGRTGSSEPMAAAQPEHPLRPYHEALRDRLINYFEVREMTHKPKMIAVTSCEAGAGVSSTAAGLAASLSETGDGNVLLVDMRGERGAAQAFFYGKPACGIEDALELESRGNALVHENLYVVAAGSSDQKLQRVLPRQFGDIVPRLKASDYDYIIFDMPPIGQTSITSKVARFMDMVLMVVESDRTDRDVARRARALLAESKATVATVLNKRKRYVPKWLLQDFH